MVASGRACGWIILPGRSTGGGGRLPTPGDGAIRPIPRARRTSARRCLPGAATGRVWKTRGMFQVAEGVFRLESGGVGPFLIEADGSVLVDAGLPRRGDEVLAELGVRAKGLAAIVLTHAHPDHIGNVEALRHASGAPVVAGLAERPLLEGDWRDASVPSRVVRRLMRPPPTVSVDRWVSDGGRVAGLEVVATPGHTPGHIALLRQGVLICGDAFITGEHPRESTRWFTTDRDLARRSIERLAGLRPELALSAHGPPTPDATAVLEQLIERWR